MQLRPYQSRAIEALDQLLFMGVRAPLMVAPTGAGKTVIAAEIIRREQEKRILFLAPRRELIHQTSAKLTAFGVPHGIILAGHRGMNLYSRVQVASIDTMISRVLRREKLKLLPFDMLVVDEAHIGLTDTRAELLGLWPEATIVGLTATPCRADGKAMGRVYDDLIEVASVAELTEQGYLVPGRYFSVSEPDLRKVRTTAGDYNRGDLGKAMNRPKLVGDIVEHWLKHAANRRTVVFATTIEHSAALATQFVMNGVTAEHVDANTPQTEREAIFARFSSGSTQVLTNCTLASVGFDLPELDCVVFARPTKSLALYLQMVGRGLRPAEGKKDCLVLDHAGCVQRFGFATEERFWTLHGTYAQDERKVEALKKAKEEAGIVEIKCPECSFIFQSSRQCPNCGYCFPVKAKSMETREGDLIELGSKPKKTSEASQKDFYLQLVGYADIKGYSHGWAAHKFKEKFTTWPSWGWKEQAGKGGGITPTPEVMRWIQSRMIAYRRAQARRERGRADDPEPQLEIQSLA